MSVFRILLATVLLPVLSVRADIVLPSVISDGMVLQRSSHVALWGWADPGERITATATWTDDEVGVEADGHGRWTLELQTPGAGGPHSVTLKGRNTITIDDVLIGEVWVASGQSNMEWPVRASDDAEREIAEADYPEIRLFNVPNQFSLHPRFDAGGAWRECSPETIAGFSAVAAPRAGCSDWTDFDRVGGHALRGVDERRGAGGVSGVCGSARDDRDAQGSGSAQRSDEPRPGALVARRRRALPRGVDRGWFR
jgi:hypothetical protein